MTEETLKNGINEILGAHGKAPKPGQLTNITRRICDKPDEFMRWAVKELCNRESLPSNLGLEFERELFPRWLAVSGKQNRQEMCCRDCDTETPGFFYVWKADTDGTYTRSVCVCSCNVRNDVTGPRISKAQAKARGYVTMHQPYTSSYRFECEVLLGIGPFQPAAEILQMLRAARNASPYPSSDPRRRCPDYIEETA